MATVFLEPSEWILRRTEHEARADRWILPRLARASAGAKHPVLDFLFTYYSLRPSTLRRWHPGTGVALLGQQAQTFLSFPGYVRQGNAVLACASRIPAPRLRSLQNVLLLLENTAARAPFTRCHGLHEWAMVYREEHVRRHDWPLRVDVATLRRTVEEQPLRCTHFDAFRFFTPDAVPRNAFQPTAHLRPEMEQPGCLHTNMDLYKWTYKFLPWTGSDLLIDAFELAVEIREVDMRASPYDFLALGYPPIRVETPGGRQEYETLQKEFAQRASPLRDRLIQKLRSLLSLRNSADSQGMQALAPCKFPD